MVIIDTGQKNKNMRKQTLTNVVSPIIFLNAFKFIGMFACCRSLSERQLKIAKEENETLRQRVREAIRISEEQKQHFRNNIEQLKQQLTETVAKRDALLAQK